MKEKIVEMAKKHGVKKAYLFGSFARGEGRKDSDLDILFEFEPGRSLFDLVNLEKDLGEKLGFEVNVFTENSLHPMIKDQILAERRLVWVKPEV